MRIRLITLLAVLLCCMTASAQTDSVKEQSGKKILIAYFSWGGNTQHVAEHIASLTGGTLFRIEPEKPYPTEYKPCTEVAKEEKNRMPVRPSKTRSKTGMSTILFSSAVPYGGGLPR